MAAKALEVPHPRAERKVKERESPRAKVAKTHPVKDPGKANPELRAAVEKVRPISKMTSLKFRAKITLGPTIARRNMTDACITIAFLEGKDCPVGHPSTSRRRRSRSFRMASRSKDLMVVKVSLLAKDPKAKAKESMARTIMPLLREGNLRLNPRH